MTDVIIPKGRMLTLTEAAEFLNRRPDTLRQQAGRGIFRARKAGRDWIVSPAEVERYRSLHRRPKIAERRAERVLTGT